MKKWLFIAPIAAAAAAAGAALALKGKSGAEKKPAAAKPAAKAAPKSGGKNNAEFSFKNPKSGVSATLPSSIVSNSFSLMEFQSRSFTRLTSQAFAKLLFHAIQLSLDGALGHAKLRRYLSGRLTIIIFSVKQKSVFVR